MYPTKHQAKYLTEHLFSDTISDISNRTSSKAFSKLLLPKIWNFSLPVNLYGEREARVWRGRAIRADNENYKKMLNSRNLEFKDLTINVPHESACIARQQISEKSRPVVLFMGTLSMICFILALRNCTTSCTDPRRAHPTTTI